MGTPLASGNAPPCRFAALYVQQAAVRGALPRHAIIGFAIDRKSVSPGGASANYFFAVSVVEAPVVKVPMGESCVRGEHND
jgi:hypothetical protein